MQVNGEVLDLNARQILASKGTVCSSSSQDTLHFIHYRSVGLSLNGFLFMFPVSQTGLVYTYPVVTAKAKSQHAIRVITKPVARGKIQRVVT